MEPKRTPGTRLCRSFDCAPPAGFQRASPAPASRRSDGNFTLSFWAKEPTEIVKPQTSTIAVCICHCALVGVRSRGAGGQLGDMTVRNQFWRVPRLFGCGGADLAGQVRAFFAHSFYFLSP